MKTLITILVLLIATTAYAFETDYVEPSGVKTADANAIITGAGFFYGIIVATDGTNPVTLKIYDALTATGTKLIPDTVITTGAADRWQYIPFNPPLSLNTGLSVDITIGAGSCAYVVYTRKK